MFIKFGDKTKKIMVKNSKDDHEKDGYLDEDCLYLDDSSENNRRVKAILKHQEENSE